VAAVPGPWGEALSRVVAESIRRLATAAQPFRLPAELVYALDPAVLPALEPSAEEGSLPVRRLCNVLAVRAAMLGELS
jgi:hypothetical protein